jgi:pimeloyl-ACP methyl ester carboxylesterase
MPHVTRDGVKLYYEESGAGDPAMVFVHGWCCDRTHHAPQVEHFSPRHRCVSVDLRGHGLSDASADGYTIAGFADDVAWICGQLGLNKPVIVGHSMGGAVALSLSARHPELPRAIVMLDGAIFFPQALAATEAQLSAAFHSDAYLEPLGAIFNGMFMASDDPARKERLVAAALAMPQHVAAAEWDAMWSNDFAGAAAACKVPALYVGSHAPVADVARLRAAMPDAIIGQTAGAGHFHQLEVPEQINPMIERFLAISL